MAMTLQNLRDFVRSFLDLDTTDLPDSLLDVFLLEGADRISRGGLRWNFYQASYTLVTTPSDPTYTYAEIGSALDSVDSLVGNNRLLQRRSHEELEEQFAFSSATGAPTFWSTWNSTVYLWPTPGAAYTYTVRGYRKPTAMVAAGSTPDMPEELHRLVGIWGCVRAYENQDDDIMANMLLSSFEQQLAVIRKRYEAFDRGGSTVLGGKRTPDLVPLNRLRYSWE
jgi:hypothetical protein